MTTLATNARPQTGDVTTLGAGELAALIANGDLSSAEVVEAHIARIAAVNPRLNAVIWPRFDAARAEAQAADAGRGAGPLGPLHGVPVTIKESLDLAGSPATFGVASRAGQRAGRDEAHVARLRDAGAIVLGKTNVAQLLLYYESDNPLHGKTSNPWDAGRTPGGSSGGEAAIIAAGGSPLGLGTDLGGSVRIPAAFCGIASLKPTAGRTPDPGRYSVPYGQAAIASQVGVLARQVVDVALALEIIGGEAAGPPVPPLGRPGEVDLARLRVGYVESDPAFPAAPGVRRAVREAAAVLARAGARVTAWRYPDAGDALDIVLGIFSADGGRYLKAALGGSKADPRIAQIQLLAGRSRPTLAALGAILRLLGQPSMAGGIRAFGHRDTAHYWRLVEAQQTYRERFAAALDAADGGPFDLILSPACPLPAFTHGASRDLVTAGPYAALYNLLGYPAGVVPIGRVRPGEESDRPDSRDRVRRVARAVEAGSAGLPLGVQVAARPWRDDLALAAMQAIEAGARATADFPATPVP